MNVIKTVRAGRHASRALIAALLLAAGAMASAPALARSSVVDESTPIVELMPLLLKHEAQLGLTDAQRQALEQFRKDAMPRRVALTQRIRELRGQLRMAILEAAPPARRDELRQQLVQAEQEHLQARERCADFVRSTLTPEQFARVRQWYLDSLP
ncbi:LTXXQ motif family protein [Tepidimonas alkaliphilus]|uniref:LTXXQ motif family protein n=1 Tax=Tepidimonas alkaliphilus TaxID=2588942 RepID=A0A554WCT5_9BURK|nr:Spy/CpxP family protein refolding chaperone [Tepidimonas alkaliphilus]TSE21389.1 LTXXQ motif family protein [Tepidimonas alkaliphilus]